MFYFPLFYLLPFGEIAMLLQMLFEKKDIMYYFEGLLLNLIFVLFFDICEH